MIRMPASNVISNASAPLSTVIPLQLPLQKITVSQSSTSISSVIYTSTTELDDIIIQKFQLLRDPLTQIEALKDIIFHCDDCILTAPKIKKLISKMQCRGLTVNQEVVEGIIRYKHKRIDEDFVEIYNNIKGMYPELDQRRTMFFMAERLIEKNILLTPSAWQQKLKACGTHIPHFNLLSTCWSIADADITTDMSLWIQHNQPGTLVRKVAQQFEWLVNFLNAFPDEQFTWHRLTKVAFCAGINPQEKIVRNVIKYANAEKARLMVASACDYETRLMEARLPSAIITMESGLPFISQLPVYLAPVDGAVLPGSDQILLCWECVKKRCHLLQKLLNIIISDEIKWLMLIHEVQLLTPDKDTLCLEKIITSLVEHIHAGELNEAAAKAAWDASKADLSKLDLSMCSAFLRTIDVKSEAETRDSIRTLFINFPWLRNETPGALMLLLYRYEMLTHSVSLLNSVKYELNDNPQLLRQRDPSSASAVTGRR
ncbi:hypothetical protein [Pantoea phytobeneficialis]|uniref:Uncharacterized protein n=1 Tax=Pantoea phytobeneficialis TaxID=2052056 RepID=A0AAP9KRV5_9GAMM|nr:hypothetical protein [Pantoea phytobeneficialis]MDO6407392.1 hypothetical protein [Pantoea phytobeneficialis]QGR09418.1 hypothetical protein CTZ24_23360 [Pantoea phytobeneficialis]